MTRAIEPAAVLGYFREWRQPSAGANPLSYEPLLVVGEGEAERLGQCRHCVMEGLAEGESKHEFVALREIQLSSQSDIAILGRVELPVELIVVRKIGPPIRAADVTARSMKEGKRRAQREPCPALIGDERLAPRPHGNVPAVPRAAAFEMRREK